MTDLASQKTAAITRLQKQGLSFMGAKQIVSAQMVTNQQDRDLLAKLLAEDSSGDSKPVARYYLENAWPK